MQIIEDNNCIACFSDAADGDLSLYLKSDEDARNIWQSLPVVKEKKLPEPVYLTQIHSDKIITINRVSKFCSGQGDSLITSLVGLPIGVFSADCVPVLFWSDKAVAAAHAGWRGTCSNISGKTVARLIEQYCIAPENITAAIGPCIRECCLELGDEVFEQFIAADSSYKEFFTRRKKWHLDMIGLNQFQLVKAGVKPDKIRILNDCTFCKEKEFFSFRRQKRRNGSMFSFVFKTA
ncbi:MAG: peptidoglycan editing factor PgeF [Candidatus Rifleibacteriota bacterium]